MRSESTRFFEHPSETKATTGGFASFAVGAGGALVLAMGKPIDEFGLGRQDSE